jgi:hypothetical protein
LSKADLRGNVCIDEQFYLEEKDVLQRKVDEKCGFKELIRKVTAQAKASTVIAATGE